MPSRLQSTTQSFSGVYSEGYIRYGWEEVVRWQSLGETAFGRSHSGRALGRLLHSLGNGLEQPSGKSSSVKGHGSESDQVDQHRGSMDLGKLLVDGLELGRRLGVLVVGQPLLVELGLSLGHDPSVSGAQNQRVEQTAHQTDAQRPVEGGASHKWWRQ